MNGAVDESECQGAGIDLVSLASFFPSPREKNEKLITMAKDSLRRHERKQLNSNPCIEFFARIDHFIAS